MRWLWGAILSLFVTFQAQSQETVKREPQAPQPPESTQASPAPRAATPDEGTLLVSLTGNRKYCVDRNELAISDRGKPREKQNMPRITTMGYKYQFSVSRRGGSGVEKLLESPTIKTIYWEEPKIVKEPPQPRLPTEHELKNPKKSYGSKRIPRWISQNTCTTLMREYRFPLPPGRYDVYLGFDLLAINGQWTPLDSDFITNLTVEAGKTARVDAKVDYAEGVRTVKLGSSSKTESSGTR